MTISSLGEIPADEDAHVDDDGRGDEEADKDEDFRNGEHHSFSKT
jgi:hypothetical protein